jgi:hypothetical protein
LFLEDIINKNFNNEDCHQDLGNITSQDLGNLLTKIYQIILILRKLI